MGNFANFFNTFSSDTNERGKQFEQFVKWFLENDPQWSTQVDQVWLWDQYPNNWGRDCGIDLVFRHKNGENWAVQAKCYAPTTQITKADVDSFISESNRNGIHKRLLIATTNLIGVNAKQVCDAQDKPVIRFLLSNFEDADIEYPSTFEDFPRAKRKEKPKPREYQLEAIQAVTAKFKGVDRGQLIMACGTGKTYTTLWIKEKLKSESTLVLLPSLGLLSQTLHEWTSAKNIDFSVLCVCSDKSVSKKGADEFVHDVSDLAFPVTSNIDEISNFLNQSGNKVIFSTYQSSNLISEAQIKKQIPSFDLAIADEAHRCAGRVDGAFSIILDGNKIRANKRLFVTATPRTYSTNLQKHVSDLGVKVVGMDDIEVFGRPFYTLTFGQAIERNLLSDYRVVVIGVDSKEIASRIESRDFVKTESGIISDAKSLAAQVALLKIIKEYNLSRLISFHNKVSGARNFAESIKDVADWIEAKNLSSGKLKADYVSGDMPTNERRRKLSIFKSISNNQIMLLTNARCLSEGVDVPSLDAVAFIDPRASQVDIIQSVGRAIRLSPNKTFGMIILPVFIDGESTPDTVLFGSSFKSIWDVLNALKSHDDILSEELDSIRVGLGKNGVTQVASGFRKITVDMPSSVGREFVDALKTRLVESTTNPWSFWFGLLCRYVDENGSSQVPASFVTSNGYPLGSWVSTQRANKGKLSIQQIKKIESIPGWTWSILEDQWEMGYQELVKFQEAMGHCKVNKSYKTSNGFALGRWVATQRVNKEALSNLRKNKLNEIKGWIWSEHDARWLKGFRSLISYIENNNIANISSKYIDPDGFPLGSWVSTQRKNKDTLSIERKQRLEETPGWIWSVSEVQWLEGYRKLEEFIARNKSSEVPHRYVSDNGFKLGIWVSTQRSSRDKLELSRKNMLEDLVGWRW